MIRAFLSRLLTPVQVAQRTEPVVSAPSRPVITGAPVYPPIDQGVAFGTPEGVIQSQADMLRRLRLLAGVDQQQFEQLYGGVLRSLAAYVDLLPASEAGTHMGAGGLFRLAIEIGFYARQASEAVIFAGRDGMEKRRELEPRWRYATFLAGLCCELYRPLARMVVVSESGEQWPMHRMGMADWMTSIRASRYFVNWVQDDQQYAAGSASMIVSKLIIPDASMQYLQEGHPRIIPAMLEAILAEANQPKGNPVAEVVSRIRRKVIERDAVLAPKNYGRLTVGTHLEPHLIDAMRQLVGEGAWACNQKRSRLWYAKDGLFIVWRTAAKEMREVLERNSVSGIPQDATTLAETLEKAGVFVRDGDGDIYWKIKTPLSDSELIAVRLASPETLLVALEDDARPTQLEVPIVVGAQKATSAIAQVKSPASPKPEPAPAPATTTLDLQQSKPAEAQVQQDLSCSSNSAEQVVDSEDVREPEKTPSRTKRAPFNGDEPKGPGAIPAVEEVVLYEVPDDLAKSMSPAVRSVISRLITEQRAGELDAVMGLQPEGLAISMEHLGWYGIEVTKLMVDLGNLGWLYAAPENPKRKIHKATIQGKEVSCAILQIQAAQDLGFKV